jgi:hypothetical protein
MKTKLYKAITVSNTSAQEINNFIIKSTDFKNQEGVVKIKLLSSSDEEKSFVVKNTVITSDSSAQLKVTYEVENPCLLRDSELKHVIKPIQDPHGREDTIQDEYNYIFDEKTVITIEKILPNTSLSIYIYRADREILSDLINNADVAIHSIDLLR